MTVPYTKPWLSLADQIALMTSRGMTVANHADAEQCLSNIGYYRLSGYWYPYRDVLPVPTTDPAALPAQAISDDFRAGTSLQQVLDLYEFDRTLKLLVLDAIERIEIAVRVKVGYVLGRRDRFAHLNRAHLDGRFTTPGPNRTPSTYDKWLTRMNGAQSQSKEDFIGHFAKYGGRLPVWVVTEILDFGALSYLYEGMKSVDRNEVANEFGVRDANGAGHGRMLANWMRVINYVRNICAHHSRLWNRNMTVQLRSNLLRSVPTLTHVHSGSPNTTSRIYGALCVLQHLLDAIHPGTTWASDLRRHINTGLAGVGNDQSQMGFPTGWETETLWQSGP
jgi:abortive infection bacteriophage resistance protein